MDERALIDAIRTVVREEMKQEIEPIKEDISNMMEDISGLKGLVPQVEALKEDMSTIKDGISKLKADVSKLNHELVPKVNVIYDGIINSRELTPRVERLEDRTGKLEDDVFALKQAQ